MPRYNFHVGDGTIAPDSNGVDLASVADARDVAMRFAGELLKEPKQFPENGDWGLDVTDPQGLILFTLFIGLTDAPAIGPRITVTTTPNGAGARNDC